MPIALAYLLESHCVVMNVSVGMTIYKVTWWYNIALSSHKQIRKKNRMQVLLDLGGDLRTALPNAGQFQDTEKISVYKKKKKKVWFSKITFFSCGSSEGAFELTPAS